VKRDRNIRYTDRNMRIVDRKIPTNTYGQQMGTNKDRNIRDIERNMRTADGNEQGQEHTDSR